MPLAKQYLVKNAGAESPFWLGAFPVRTPGACDVGCGGTACYHATWLWRGKPLVLSLCDVCIVQASDKAHGILLGIDQWPRPKSTTLPERVIPMLALGAPCDPDEAPDLEPRPLRSHISRGADRQPFGYARPCR